MLVNAFDVFAYTLFLPLDNKNKLDYTSDL